MLDESEINLLGSFQQNQSNDEYHTSDLGGCAHKIKLWWTKYYWRSTSNPPPLNIFLLKSHQKGPITQLLVHKIHVFVNNKSSLVYESDEMSHSVYDQTPKCTSKKHFFFEHTS